MNKETTDIIAKIYMLQAQAIASGIKITGIEVPYKLYRGIVDSEFTLFASEDRQGTLAGIAIGCEEER